MTRAEALSYLRPGSQWSLDNATGEVMWLDGTDPPSETEITAAMDLPPTVPVHAISDRQFAQQLAILGVITEAEALAWAARGELPAALEAAIAALPESDRFAARMLLASATTYERAHPLVPVLGALLGYDAEAIDDLWRAAAQL